MNNYEIRVIPDKDCDGNVFWTAFYPKIEAVVGGGDTPDEAILEAQENLELYIKYLEESKKEIPLGYEENTYSGKIALRVSKSIHQKISQLSEEEGISLNLFINNAISNYIGLKSYDMKFEEKFNKMQECTENNMKISALGLKYSKLLYDDIWCVTNNSKISYKE